MQTTMILRSLISAIVSIFIFNPYNFVSANNHSSIPDPNDGLYYIAPKINANIDGCMDEWTSIFPVILNNKEQVEYLHNDWKGTTDCSAKFWWAWNDKGIIIATEIVDDSISTPFNAARLWSNDCIQFTLDIEDDNSQDHYNNDDYEFAVSLIDTKAVVYEFSYSEHRSQGVRNFPCEIELTNDTLKYEILIPWEKIGIDSPLVGKHIGASFVVFDNDGNDYRGWLQWSAGITKKKFTMPYANILFFDPQNYKIQTVITKPFLSENDSLDFWIYSKKYQKNVIYHLFKNGETLIQKKFFVRRNRWQNVTISVKYLKWGWLKLNLAARKTSYNFNIAVWSKKHIADQLSYLVKQVDVLKNIDVADKSSSLKVKYWVDWLQTKFSKAKSNFDFFDVMNQTQKRINQVPNFYMNKQVFYNQESNLVENIYFSERENISKRFLLYLNLN